MLRPPAIDPAMSWCVPADTVVLAGIDLDQLRSSSLYQSLPPAALAAIEGLRNASSLLIASNGKTLLFVARGNFREAPPAAVLIATGLALAGPDDSIRAATAQYKTRASGAPYLLSRASDIAIGKPIWIVAQGGVSLPFTGNATNLNRILHFTEYTTLTAQIDSQIQFDASGVCRTPDAARQLEESVRALLTFAGAAAAPRSNLAAILSSVEVRRDDVTVRASLSTSAQSARSLLQGLTH